MCCDEQMGSYKEKGSVIWIVISEPVRIAKEFPLKKIADFWILLKPTELRVSGGTGTRILKSSLCASEAWL